RRQPRDRARRRDQDSGAHIVRSLSLTERAGHPAQGPRGPKRRRTSRQERVFCEGLDQQGAVWQRQDFAGDVAVGIAAAEQEREVGALLADGVEQGSPPIRGISVSEMTRSTLGPRASRSSASCPSVAVSTA